jgi:excisionase family DNA binding protein
MKATQTKPPRFEDLPDMCTPEQAQEFLQIGKNMLYALVKNGTLTSVRFGRLIRIPKQALLGGQR